MNTDLIAEHGTVQEPSERFDMRANFEGLIQLLARNLYPEPDVFVRELIQNAHDGIRLRQELEPVHAGRIDVELRPGDREIVFRDDGLGMDRDDIKQFLSVIGSTGTGTARARLEEANHATAVSLIGQFGIGMLSAFVVAERVTVRTRKRGSAESFVWQNEGRTECRLSRGPEMDVGTEIVVSVARAHAYMLQSTRIREAIVRYCDFLPLPVHLNGRGPVNLVHAPWDRNGWPSEDVRDTAYRDFVSHRYPDVPLEVIPVEIEEPVHARGALYITDRRIPDMDTAGVVDIFVRRMFVRGGDAELLPPWAKFVRGLIECPDLQPTAARDNVRRDGWAYEALRQRLAELIVERLGYLAAHRPDRFREINRWHHYHLKGMALFHEDFFAQVAALLLFDTNRGLLSLGELSRTEAARPGKVGSLGGRKRERARRARSPPSSTSRSRARHRSSTVWPMRAGGRSSTRVCCSRRSCSRSMRRQPVRFDAWSRSTRARTAPCSRLRGRMRAPARASSAASRIRSPSWASIRSRSRSAATCRSRCPRSCCCHPIRRRTCGCRRSCASRGSSSRSAT
jgi:HSP90 family molecular chaperone